jgi:hypothetical protein
LSGSNLPPDILTTVRFKPLIALPTRLAVWSPFPTFLAAVLAKLRKLILLSVSVFFPVINIKRHK